MSGSLIIKIIIFSKLISCTLNASELSLARFLSEVEAQRVELYGGYTRFQVSAALNAFFFKNGTDISSERIRQFKTCFFKTCYKSVVKGTEIAESAIVDREFLDLVTQIDLPEVLSSPISYCIICRNDIAKDLPISVCFWSEEHVLHSECAIRWLEANSNTCPSCRRQFTPPVDGFVLAVQNGDIDLIIKFIQQGIDVNAKNSKGRVALVEAAKIKRRDIVELLLDNRASVNMLDGVCNTAIIAAAANGCEEIVELLAESGADPNIGGFYCFPALKWAEFWGNDKIVRILRSYGAR